VGAALAGAHARVTSTVAEEAATTLEELRARAPGKVSQSG
jgi:hypothetical protein